MIARKVKFMSVSGGTTRHPLRFESTSRSSTTQAYERSIKSELFVSKRCEACVSRYVARENDDRVKGENMEHNICVMYKDRDGSNLPTHPPSSHSLFVCAPLSP